MPGEVHPAARGIDDDQQCERLRIFNMPEVADQFIVGGVVVAGFPVEQGQERSCRQRGRGPATPGVQIQMGLGGPPTVQETDGSQQAK